MSEFSLNALIDKALERSKEPDPHVIARRLLPKIPEDQLRRVVASLLVERVTLRIRAMRSDHLAAELSTERTNSSDSSTARSQGRSRWERHSSWRTQDGWKFREDLTPDDCDWVAGEYEKRAAANARIAQEFRQLASRLRAEGAARVGDLRESVELAA